MDSCAFDPKYSPEDCASLRIFSLYEEEAIILGIAHSTIKEIEHPNTPPWVKNEAGAMIYTISTGLTQQEVEKKKTILKILIGNGKPEKMEKDADLHDVFAAIIVKPSQFLEIYDACAPTLG